MYIFCTLLWAGIYIIIILLIELNIIIVHVYIYIIILYKKRNETTQMSYGVSMKSSRN